MLYSWWEQQHFKYIFRIIVWQKKIRDGLQPPETLTEKQRVVMTSQWMRFPSSPTQVDIYFMDKLHSTWISLIIMDIKSNCLFCLHSAQGQTWAEQSKSLCIWSYIPWKTGVKKEKLEKQTSWLTLVNGNERFLTWGMALWTALN